MELFLLKVFPVAQVGALCFGDTMEDGLLGALHDRFQLATFREGQREIIETVLRGRDGMAVMPTGGGKSLCYQLPALYLKGLVLVVSPLISLMKDQVRSLRALGVPAGCLFSGQTLGEKREVFRDIRDGSHYLLYLSPERIQKDGFAPWLQRQTVSLFAVDEAHCISKWGHDFREDYGRLSILRELKPEAPILALTASATPRVLRDIERQLNLNQPDRHIHGFYRPNLFYQVEWCEDDLIKMAFLRQALRQTPLGKILIYCGTRKTCEQLVEELSGEYPDCAFYHAGMATAQRSQVQEDFEQGRVRILAATNAFGMGIDHPDIRLVVHYQMPANIESLYQEVGRAGRDGRPSTCLLLYSKKDKGLHAYFINQSKADAVHQRARWKALETITQFSEGGECRHAGILSYFRDSRQISECGHCDSCVPDSGRMIQKKNLFFSTTRPERRKPKEKTKKIFEEVLDEAAEIRAKHLKKWRKEYADAQNIPAFIVFSNKTLKDLAAKAPANLAELSDVYGMGPKKIEAFGEILLGEIKRA